MARLHIHPIGLFLIFFGLLVWVVALGGLAASTKYCHDNSTTTLTSSNGTTTTVNAAIQCGDKYQLEWWSVWFEFLLLLAMLLTCFTNAFDRARSIFLAYLSMVTVLLTLMARAFITDFFTSSGAFTFKDYKSDAANAAAAGAVLLCICNFALIIFVGLGHKPNAGHGSGAPVPLSALGANAPEVKYQPSNF